MKITVKLFAGLVEYLPANAAAKESDNECILAVDNATPNSLLAKLKIPLTEIKVVMVNGEFIAADNYDRQLKDGDIISIWPAIQGG